MDSIENVHKKPLFANVYFITNQIFKNREISGIKYDRHMISTFEPDHDTDFVPEQVYFTVWYKCGDGDSCNETHKHSFNYRRCNIYYLAGEKMLIQTVDIGVEGT